LLIGTFPENLLTTKVQVVPVM